jgi:hypothetical protein
MADTPLFRYSVYRWLWHHCPMSVHQDLRRLWHHSETKLCSNHVGLFLCRHCLLWLYSQSRPWHHSETKFCSNRGNGGSGGNDVWLAHKSCCIRLIVDLTLNHLCYVTSRNCVSSCQAHCCHLWSLRSLFDKHPVEPAPLFCRFGPNCGSNWALV